jgi:hypothetical protein
VVEVKTDPGLSGWSLSRKRRRDSRKLLEVTGGFNSVGGTSWSEVTIAWDDGEANAVSHNDMAKVERVPNKLI